MILLSNKFNQSLNKFKVIRMLAPYARKNATLNKHILAGNEASSCANKRSHFALGQCVSDVYNIYFAILPLSLVRVSWPWDMPTLNQHENANRVYFYNVKEDIPRGWRYHLRIYALCKEIARDDTCIGYRVLIKRMVVILVLNVDCLVCYKHINKINIQL